MYTEDEAIEKVCPKLIHLDARPSVTACVGSKCMAWRWSEPQERDGHYERVGYCGLAGCPHEWA